MTDSNTPGPIERGRYEPYPEYKDSGVEWLGEIPAHWDSRALKYLATFKSGGTPKKHDPHYWLGDIPWVSPKDMGSGVINDTVDHITPEAVRESSTRLVDEGAVLVVVRSGILRHRIPVAIAGREVALNQDLKALMSIGEALPRYLRYFIEGMQEFLLFEWRKEGATVESLETEAMAATRIPVPPHLEQRAIGAFLDRETIRIDALDRKQEKFIRLLQEKRTALISHIVAKGLDSDVPTRDSGVEWLGDIPAHWAMQRLRTLVSITTGSRDTIDQRQDGTYPFFVRSPVVERIDTWSFDGEAVLTAGDGVGVAKVFHHVNGKFDFHQRVYKFSDFDVVTGRFFFHYFGASLRFETLRGTAKSTVDSLRLPMLQNFPVVVPPLLEQHTIIAYLDRETATIDAMIAKVNEAIARLNEYRTALISAAVTGKIDLRDFRKHGATQDMPTTRRRE